MVKADRVFFMYYSVGLLLYLSYIGICAKEWGAGF